MTLSRPKEYRKTCKHCGEKFKPSMTTQKVCSVACAIAVAPAGREKAVKAIQANARKEHAAQKEKTKRKGDHAREAQQIFNQWIRLRDQGQPCISCGTTADVQMCAGHYRTVGANPELRFEPLNVHLQCNRNCNMGLSGNILGYRPRLIEKIGLEAVEWLEGPHEPKRYTIADFQAIKAEYRVKIKQLKAQING